MHKSIIRGKMPIDIADNNCLFLYTFCLLYFHWDLSLLFIQLPTPFPADESMRDETPRTGILFYTHEFLLFVF